MEKLFYCSMIRACRDLILLVFAFREQKDCGWTLTTAYISRINQHVRTNGIRLMNGLTNTTILYGNAGANQPREQAMAVWTFSYCMHLLNRSKEKLQHLWMYMMLLRGVPLHH